MSIQITPDRKTDHYLGGGVFLKPYHSGGIWLYTYDGVTVYNQIFLDLRAAINFVKVCLTLDTEVIDQGVIEYFITLLKTRTSAKTLDPEVIDQVIGELRERKEDDQ